MNKTFETTAVFNEKAFHHFGIHPLLASMYGDKPEDIQTLNMKVSDDQSMPPESTPTEADYWGWYDHEQEKFTMIYAQRFLLNMCFTYGMEAEEARNRGKAYRLEIIENK